MENNYFNNLPFKEETIRKVFACLKEMGFFYNSEFDPFKALLSDLISPPEGRGGIKIIRVTEGVGVHIASMFHFDNSCPFGKYDVEENQVYVTIDTRAPLSGGIYTYVFEKDGDKLKKIKKFTHARS